MANPAVDGTFDLREIADLLCTHKTRTAPSELSRHYYSYPVVVLLILKDRICSVRHESVRSRDHLGWGYQRGRDRL